MNDKKVIVIIGPPGCGKGTQINLISKDYHCQILEMGETLRKIANSNSKNSKIIKEYTKDGKLLPDKYVLEIVRDFINKNNGNLLLFDGFPRYLNQAKNMESILKANKINYYCVVYIDISDKEVLKRLLLRGREDDRPNTIKTRIKIFNEHTKPMLEYFNKKEKLIKIEGEDTIENTYKKIKKTLENII